MPKVTRIKARDDKSDKADQNNDKVAKNNATQKVAESKSKTAKIASTPKTKINKKDKGNSKKPAPKFLRILAAPFVFIAKPFRPLGRYIKASWQEIRQVRWPDRKTTWKMTLSVIIYVIIFAAVIMLLDALFTFIFNKLLGV